MAQVPVGVQLAGPGVKEVTHPLGSAGAVTLSKFSLKTSCGPAGVTVAVAVAVGVGGGGVPVAVGVGVGTAMHCPRRIETEAEPLLATAKSWFPSPLKSPMATELGLTATLDSVEQSRPSHLPDGSKLCLSCS